jgi:type I restriction enzyme, S subunit
MSCELTLQQTLFKSCSVPAGWSIVKLSDLGEVNRGRSRHRPRYADHLYGGPYPFIQTGDIKASQGKIKKHTQTYSEAGLAQSRLWPAGTMCITIAANIAETSILTFPACFPDSVIGFIADKSKCDVNFVEYMIRYLKSQIQREAIGSVQDNINLGTFERIHFALPLLTEQFAISKVLGNFDSKIEINQEINRLLEGIGQAVFKRWFVDFEFPNQVGKPYKSSGGEMVLNEKVGKPIPKGWQVGEINDLCSSITNGGTPKRMESKYWNGDIPWFKTGE